MNETLGLVSSIICILIIAAWERYRLRDPEFKAILSYIATSLKKKKVKWRVIKKGNYC